MLTRQQARRFYDRFGARQNGQGWYEDPATKQLLEHGDFGRARQVVEFGCGTGRFARRLLDDFLPPEARYRGYDMSATMVSLARQRVAPYGERATVVQTDGSLRLDLPDACCDRLVSNFVVDLLSEDDVRALLEEAHRLLQPGALLTVSGLAHGFTPLSRVVMGLWGGVHRLRPSLVGGCRPLRLPDFLDRESWELVHHRNTAVRGLAAEATVAVRRSG